MPCKHEICKQRREKKEADLADIDAKLDRGEFSEEVRAKIKSMASGKCMCVPGVAAMETESPVDFLERMMLNLRVAIGSYGNHDFTTPMHPEMSDEDIEYIEELEEIIESYPEQGLLFTKLSHILSTCDTVCRKLRETTGKLNDHMLSAAHEARYNSNRLFLLRDNLLLINEMATFVKEKQFTVYQAAFQHVGVKYSTIEEQLLVERDGLKLDQKTLRQENRFLRLTFEEVLRLMDEGTCDAFHNVERLLESMHELLHCHCHDDHSEDMTPMSHPKPNRARENELAAKLFFAMKKHVVDAIGHRGYETMVRENCGSLLGIAAGKLSKGMRIIVDTDIMDASKVLGKGFDIAQKLPQTVIDDFMSRRPAEQSHYTISHKQMEGVIAEHSTATAKTLSMEAKARAEVMKTERTEAQHAKLSYMWNRLMEGTRFLPTMKPLFSGNGKATYEDTWKAVNLELKQLQEDSKKYRTVQEKHKKELALRRAAEMKLELARHEIEQLKGEMTNMAQSTHDKLPCPTSKTLLLRERQLSGKSKENDELRGQCEILAERLKTRDDEAKKDVDEARRLADSARKEMHKLQDENEIQIMRHAEETATLSEDLERATTQHQVEYANLQTRYESLNKKAIKYSSAINRYKEEYVKLKADRDQLKDDKIRMKQMSTSEPERSVPEWTSQDSSGVDHESTEVSRLTAELLEQDRVTRHFQESVALMKKQIDEAKDALDLAKARIEHQNMDIENLGADVRGCKQERDDAFVTARRSQLKLSEYEQTQKAILDEIENERVKSKRLQEKLGAMMTAFVAAGLPLP